MRLKVRAQSAPWRAGVEFMAMCDGAYGRPIIMDHPASEGIVIEPTFALSIQAAQLLMDDLWNCGLRPTEGQGSAGQLASIKYHLEDMRTLVFKKREQEEKK